jgi:glucose-inhibited division protein A
MRFAFTDDQLMVRDAVADLLGKECPPERVRWSWNDQKGRDPQLWAALAAMGVIGLTAPEDNGGLGMNEVDLLPILTEAGRALGLVGDVQWDFYCRKRDAVAQETERLKSLWVNPHILEKHEAERVLGTVIEREYNLLDLLRRPAVGYDSLVGMSFGADPAPAGAGAFDADIADQVIGQVEIRAKYQGYIDRQAGEVERSAAQEHTVLPADLDYAKVRGLTREAQTKLAQQRPETLGQASRIQGITPATISLLLVHLKKSGAARQGLAA